MSDNGMTPYQVFMAHAINGLADLEWDELRSYLDMEGPMARRVRDGAATRGELVVEIAGRLAEAAVAREPSS